MAPHQSTGLIIWYSNVCPDFRDLKVCKLEKVKGDPLVKGSYIQRRNSDKRSSLFRGDTCVYMYVCVGVLYLIKPATDMYIL